MDDYDELLKKQNKRCAICKTDKSGGQGKWHVDHNHITGKIRGLLCNNCNRGLGFFKDNIALIYETAEYLERTD